MPPPLKRFQPVPVFPQMPRTVWSSQRTQTMPPPLRRFQGRPVFPQTPQTVWSGRARARRVQDRSSKSLDPRPDLDKRLGPSGQEDLSSQDGTGPSIRIAGSLTRSRRKPQTVFSAGALKPQQYNTFHQNCWSSHQIPHQMPLDYARLHHHHSTLRSFAFAALHGYPLVELCHYVIFMLLLDFRVGGTAAKGLYNVPEPRRGRGILDKV